MPEGYPPWRTRRSLTRGAVFDPTLTTPCTILHLGSDAPDGPITVELWRQLGLETEHLQVGDQIEIEYESFWAHRIPDPEHAIGTYIERWVATAIHWMSRPAPAILRTPPPVVGTWGAFEAMLYQQYHPPMRGY
jgi:hypothetical protein